MDVPTTVETALEDRPIDGAVCLEAGAGVGNATAGLLANGAARVYAVTNDDEHARITADRVAKRTNDPGECEVLRADLRRIPLADDSADVITAHALCNVVPPAALGTIAAELTRVAKPGGHLVVDDYAPPPDDAAVRELFAVENAARELSDGRPALSFYPGDVLRRLFEGHGWAIDRRRTLLDPVPWTEGHLAAHVAATRSSAADLPPDVGEPLTERAERLAAEIGAESVGEMYSLALTR
jgi:SAM-dependent methyltransferase